MNLQADRESQLIVYDMNRTKKIFLTGGTAGIGRATTLQLAEEGFDVFVIGRDGQKLDDLLNDAKDLGVADRIAYELQDLTDQAALPDFLRSVWESHGPFDVLINNAGVGFSGVVDAEHRDLVYMTKTNLDAYLLLSSFFAERMIAQKIEGDIINIGSMSSDTRDGGSSGYVASKAGIQGFTEALRKEINPHNIRVTLIEPGSVGTDMQSPSPEEQAELQEKKEMLKAEDISRLISFVINQDRRVTIVEVKVKPLRQFI